MFEADVLERLIKYTGGSLRDLFHTINSSAKRAERRNSESISMEDAERALEEAKELYQKALSVYRNVLGENHDKTKAVYDQLADLCKNG